MIVGSGRLGEMPEGFAAHMLPFVQKRCPRAVEILACGAEGYDMIGDTESGFHAQFSVRFMVALEDGSHQFVSYDGSEIADLWWHAVDRDA